MRNDRLWGLLQDVVPVWESLPVCVCRSEFVGQIQHLSSRALKIDPRRVFPVGADVSAVAKVERLDGVFREKEHPDDASAIMSQRGCNYFRLRVLANSPSPRHRCRRAVRQRDHKTHRSCRRGTNGEGHVPTRLAFDRMFVTLSL